MTLNKLREKLNDLETKAIQDDLTDYVTDIRAIQKTLAGLIEADDAKKAAKGWIKGTGIANCYQNSVSVIAYRHKEFPGLFINRGVDRDGKLLKGWFITHEKSGLYLLGGYGNMKKAALAVEKYLAGGLNWDQEAQEIVRDTAYAKAVSEAKKAA